MSCRGTGFTEDTVLLCEMQEESRKGLIRPKGSTGSTGLGTTDVSGSKELFALTKSWNQKYATVKPLIISNAPGYLNHRKLNLEH